MNTLSITFLEENERNIIKGKSLRYIVGGTDEDRPTLSEITLTKTKEKK